MKKVIILFTLFFAFCAGANAQQKYGHIDSDDILQAMPEYKMLKASLEKKRKEQENRLAGMYADYRKRQEELNSYALGLMEAVHEEKLRELEELHQSIMAYEGKAEEDVLVLQKKLLKPLNDKYLKIVKEVATENGYTFIFDLASGMVTYHPETTGDITGLVKKKMGII